MAAMAPPILCNIYIVKIRKLLITSPALELDKKNSEQIWNH
jgi:hypothetical protein